MNRQAAIALPLRVRIKTEQSQVPATTLERGSSADKTNVSDHGSRIPVAACEQSVPVVSNAGIRASASSDLTPAWKSRAGMLAETTASADPFPWGITLPWITGATDRPGLFEHPIDRLSRPERGAGVIAPKTRRSHS
jgi:hypothetical protein